MRGMWEFPLSYFSTKPHIVASHWKCFNQVLPMNAKYIDDIQIFGMNMTFISWVKRKIYISWVAKPQMKYTFFPSRDEIKVIFISKIWISFLLFCTMTLYKIAHDNMLDHKWPHILAPKTETTGAGVKKMKTSANPDNFVTKMFLMIQLRKEYPHFVFLSLVRKL